MKRVVAGTAGHIDHGKTALVKALTGIDADRLAEEKRRGITIDIGFAHLALAGAGGEALRIGFVDVPGHERFIRNMLAGVGGIDFVLLVIAADEGVKPQTREHFDICRMLNIRRGLVVLTKADAVDADTLAVARLEAEEFVRGSFLEGAPVIAVSAIRGDGLDELRGELARLASEVPAKNVDAPFRLPIDRVFTMKGFGTVVTGTLLAGSVRKEDEVEALPAGARLRVRGIQVHGAAADLAMAGERTALNLAGVTTEELARGMTLAHPDSFVATQQVDAEISLLPGVRPLKDRARVHFHVHTAETVAEVLTRVADAELRELKPGTRAFVRLRLAAPVPLLPGDRFIVRQFSPLATIGGGVVLDTAPLRGKIPPEQLAGSLRVLAEGDDRQVLALRVLRRGSAGLTREDARRETGWTEVRVDAAAGTLLGIGPLLIAPEAFSRLLDDAAAELRSFHDANPLAPGISKEELREKLGVANEVFTSALDAMLRGKRIESAGDSVRLAGRGVQMKGTEAESKRTIEETFERAGLKVPALRDVLAPLKIDKNTAYKIVTLLLRERALIKVSEELVFHRTAIDGLKVLIAQQKTKSPTIDVAVFKELTGVSRKYAIPLLEYLDRERVTRRVGDARVIL